MFLPNTARSGGVVADLTGTWPRSEADMFAPVGGLGTDTVRTVLTHHIIAGPPISYRAVLSSDGAVLTTLRGGARPLTVDVGRFFLPHVRIVDNDLGGLPDPIVIQPNVGRRLANGYVHGIDEVLRPVDV